MEKTLKKLIESIVFKKFPELTELSIKDLYEGTKYEGGNQLVVYFKSDDCLESEKQMKIDSMVKELFSMMTPSKINHWSPSINCFFDCGEGYEFKMSPGYK